MYENGNWYFFKVLNEVYKTWSFYPTTVDKVDNKI
jgi:hypothetical protein